MQAYTNGIPIEVLVVVALSWRGVAHAQVWPAKYIGNVEIHETSEAECKESAGEGEPLKKLSLEIVFSSDSILT